jgi:Cu/Ag efflux protein CusF
MMIAVALVALSSPSAAEDIFTYRVKGVVKVLPGKGTASNEILVKHEPIPDYRDEAGNIVGMAAMTMPFYLAQGVTLESVAVGDEVDMVLEQRLKPRFTEQVVSLKKTK